MDDWLNDLIFVGTSSQSADDIIKLEVFPYFGSSISDEEKSITILQWWKQNHVFPTLFSVIKKYLCIPASPISSERIFSLYGALTTPQQPVPALFWRSGTLNMLFLITEKSDLVKNCKFWRNGI